MKISRSEPGLFLSAAVHLGVLAFLLVHFSWEPKFEDAHEAIPVETITDAQFSQIMKGEKTAKEVAPKPRADRIAHVDEQKPVPPTPQAQKDVPTPPPPLKRLPDSAAASEQPPVPPARPSEPKPEAKPTPKPTPKPPEKVEEKEEPDAELVKPPPRPKPPEKKVEVKPEPQPPQPPKPPKPQEKPAPKPPKLDDVAKLLSQNKDVKANDKPPKPESGDESPARPSLNLAEISKLLNREVAQSRGSAGREVSHAASLGAASGHASKMSASMADAFDGFLRERYKQCWNYLSFSDAPRYVPKIRVAFRQDGSLAAIPVLLNPPADPTARSLADSALRAVRSCDPMKIPSQFAPYYDQWKDSTVAFNPQG